MPRRDASHNGELLQVSDALAKRLYDTKQFEIAAQACEVAIALGDRAFPTLINAARCYIYAGNPRRAEELLREARASDTRPLGDRSDLEFLVLALGWQGRFDEAMAVIESLPDSDANRYNLGWHYLRKGRFKEAFPLLEHGKKSGIWGDKDFTLTTPYWDGSQDINGRTVLLNLERGFGDQMIQVRHARDLAARGASVVVRCHPKLVMALSQAEGVSQATMGVPAHDYWLSGMSAPIPLGLEKADGRPYLKPVPWMVEKWEKRLGPKTGPRIAVRWQGNPEFEYEQVRTIPATSFIDSLRGLGKLFSVQRDEGSQHCPPDVENLAPELETWEDTIAALSLMDVVVSSCTAIVHAAAALGVSTVVITPVLSYYPWAEEAVLPRSNWYDSVWVAKQKRVGQWQEAIDEAAVYARAILNQ